MTRIAVSVGGVLSRPETSGRIEITNAGISFIDLPNGLSGINGVLVFDENRLRVRSLTAQSGGGALTIGGFIAWSRGISFDLTATGRDIRLRYPAGVSAIGNADLRLIGSPKDSRLTGDITITRFGVNPRFDFALYLARSKQPPAMLAPDSPLNNLHFDVRIVSTPALHVQSSMAKVTGTADLRLRGTAARPVLLGRLTDIEGEVSLAGTKYQIERGEVLFASPTGIKPLLNIEATTRVREYEISLGFHGEVDKLSTTYRSDPPLPEGDIIALLALGRTREESVLNPQATTTFTETASNAILGQALNTAVSSRVQKLFGVSRIKIDPEVGGPENNPNARVTIEQQVSNKVTLTFITNLSQSAQQIVQVEYNINRRLSVVGVRDQNGVLGFDVKYRQRKR
jgi:translocation and assembly module TamB